MSNERVCFVAWVLSSENKINKNKISISKLHQIYRAILLKTDQSVPCTWGLILHPCGPFNSCTLYALQYPHGTNAVSSLGVLCTVSSRMKAPASSFGGFVGTFVGIQRKHILLSPRKVISAARRDAGWLGRCF